MTTLESSQSRETRGAVATHDLGVAFGRGLSGNETVLLFGDLGSGKTVFTQGVAVALGIEAEIQSPTYTLIHQYRADDDVAAASASPTLVHIDLYRLSRDEIESAGVDESLAGPGVKIVEWADRLAWAPGDAWMITIEKTAPDRRRIEIRRAEG